MADSARSTRIVTREFICRGPEAHRFVLVVRSASELRVGERIPASAEFKPLGGRALWLPLPLCPISGCDFTAEQLEFYDPQTAAVPESHRFVAWLSPDGQRLSVPGRNDAPMPARYVRAGYRRVEGHSMADLDRFDAIRAAQTGNAVAHEMNYDEQERVHRRSYVPDFDGEDVTKSEI